MKTQQVAHYKSLAAQAAAQHTPGPWATLCDRASAPKRMALVTTSANNGNHRVQAIDCTGSGETYQADCSNARLIAAAPDLLDALQALLTANEYGGGERAAQVAARAAIAKATQS